MSKELRLKYFVANDQIHQIYFNDEGLPTNSYSQNASSIVKNKLNEEELHIVGVGNFKVFETVKESLQILNKNEDTGYFVDENGIIQHYNMKTKETSFVYGVNPEDLEIKINQVKSEIVSYREVLFSDKKCFTPDEDYVFFTKEELIKIFDNV